MIRGNKTTLRAAVEDDRRDIYTWLVSSDVMPSMMGPPEFPDVSIPTWQEFCVDYAPHFFDGSQPNPGRSFIIDADGKPVGHVNYDGLDAERSIAELDIWMRAQSCCGNGYGTDALIALMGYLYDEFAIGTFIIRPSIRNQRAVRAYQKAGFQLSTLSTEDQTRIYGPGDYCDTITLECKVSAKQLSN